MRPVWPSSEYGLLPTTPNSCWSNSSNCLRNNLIQPVPIILRPSSWYHNSAIFSLDKRTVICPSDSILAGDRIYDTIFRTWAIMSFFRQGTSLSLLLENCFLWLLSESDCFLTFWFLFSAPFIQQQSINSGLAYSLTWDDVGSHFALIYKVDPLSLNQTMWAF